MSARLSDTETRVELERINPELVKCFNRTIIKYLPDAEYITAYRLLAEQHKALREIIELAEGAGRKFGFIETAERIHKIAKNACKEE